MTDKQQTGNGGSRGHSSRFPTMANGGSRRGLYGEGRRTAVAAETHSPPHVQRASLALVIEAGGGSEAGR